MDFTTNAYLKSRPIKQLITQTQLQKYKIPYDPSIPQAFKRNLEIPLTLHNPIKIVHFFIKRELGDDGLASGLPQTIQFKSAGIKFNGNFLFNDSYAKSVYDNRFKNSVSYGTARIGSYSFALYPTSNEPSGHLNLNRIIDKTFVMDQAPGHDGGVLNIYGTCYNMMVYSHGLCGLKY